jgi:ATP-binding cassette subfamily B (MDR/TAP) protein 1
MTPTTHLYFGTHKTSLSPTIDSESIEGVKLDSVRGEVTLDHVYFTYPSRADVPVLKDLSVRFAPGQTSALVGPSGSGKSTIVALIERFYDPTPVSEDEQSVGTGGGAVKLDGVDLRELNVRWLRGQIGLVSQEPTLFGITIKANVAHGLEGTPWEHAEDEKKFELVKAACVKANADSFIQKLSRGMLTLAYLAYLSVP